MNESKEAISSASSHLSGAAKVAEEVEEASRARAKKAREETLAKAKAEHEANVEKAKATRNKQIEEAQAKEVRALLKRFISCGDLSLSMRRFLHWKYKTI